MIDIKLIRTNPDLVKANIKKREMNLDSVVDEILEIDAKRRELTGSTEAMKAEQNACTKKIPAMKKAGEDVAPVMAEMKALSEKIKAADAALGEIEAKQQELMLGLPNMPDEDVAAGGKEQNVPVHYFGEQPKFDFEPKNHVDLCESLGMIDYPRGAKVGGNGAWIYRGAGARLEWTLGLDIIADSGLMNKSNVALLRQAGYKYILGARIRSERAPIKQGFFH